MAKILLILFLTFPLSNFLHAASDPETILWMPMNAFMQREDLYLMNPQDFINEFNKARDPILKQLEEYIRIFHSIAESLSFANFTSHFGEIETRIQYLNSQSFKMSQVFYREFDDAVFFNPTKNLQIALIKMTLSAFRQRSPHILKEKITVSEKLKLYQAPQLPLGVMSGISQEALELLEEIKRINSKVEDMAHKILFLEEKESLWNLKN